MMVQLELISFMCKKRKFEENKNHFEEGKKLYTKRISSIKKK